MTRISSTLVTIATAGLLSVACGFEHTTTNLLEPTPPATQPPPPAPQPDQSLIGTWVSAPLPPNSRQTVCGNIRFQITSQTTTTVSGPISAECGGGLQVSGNGLGQLNGNSLTLTATGNGTMPGVSTCAIALGGNGTFENNNTLRLNYSANTCVGPTSGSGVLQKQ